jgi:hypothetical protein
MERFGGENAIENEENTLGQFGQKENEQNGSQL